MIFTKVVEVLLNKAINHNQALGRQALDRVLEGRRRLFGISHNGKPSDTL